MLKSKLEESRALGSRGNKASRNYFKLGVIPVKIYI